MYVICPQFPLTTYPPKDCFLKREESDLKYHRPSSLRSHTISLTRDIVESVRETGSAAVILPKTIMNVLSSRACRSELDSLKSC